MSGSKILPALAKVMAKAEYVQKTGRNDFQNYSYATEADLLAVIRPAMLEEGLLLIPSLHSYTNIDEHGNTTITMDYTLAHTSGEIWPEKIRGIGQGNDRARSGAVGDKGVYKALTGCNKYVLFKLFQIATGDDPEVGNEVDRAESKAAPPTVKKEPPKHSYDDVSGEIIHLRAHMDPTITDLAVEAVDKPKREVVDKNTELEIPADDWTDFCKIVSMFIETQTYKDIRAFWKTNQDALHILKSRDESTYKELFDKMQSRKAS